MLAPLGLRAEAADFIAMLATAEAFKPVAGYGENPSRAMTEIESDARPGLASIRIDRLWMF